MTKRRKQAIILLALSVPMMWWGFNQFIYGSGHSTLEAIAVSLSCTGGLTCFFGGLYLLFTKGRGEDLLASQTKVGDSPIQKTINKKVNEMAETNSTSVEMMKREKELEARRKELEGLLKEVTFEEKALEEQLLDKGWIKKDGEWGIE